LVVFFFFQAEDGIRDFHVTGVQTCALPISSRRRLQAGGGTDPSHHSRRATRGEAGFSGFWITAVSVAGPVEMTVRDIAIESFKEIGRASCRERVEISVGEGSVKKREKKLDM